MANRTESAGTSHASGSASQTGHQPAASAAPAHLSLASPRPGPTAAQESQASVILNQIAEIADMLHRIAVTMVAEAADQDSVRAPLSVRYLSGQLGWLADLAATKLGDEALVGGAEQWMLPPLYHAHGSELPAEALRDQLIREARRG